MPIKPWKRIGEPEVLAEGFGKTFTRQKFQDPQGGVHDFYFFEQPSWSVVLAITDNQSVIVVRQFKQGVEGIIEELPGGIADFASESPEAVLRRELREETGYEPAEVISLGSSWMNTRNSHTKGYHFLALGCRKIGQPKPSPREQIVVFEVPLNQWLARVLNGEIEEWSSCITTFRALKRLGITVG